MFRCTAPDLPAEVLKLIFSTRPRQPGGEPDAPVRSDKERVRSLVSELGPCSGD